jgi:hypothetical protein
VHRSEHLIFHAREGCWELFDQHTPRRRPERVFDEQPLKVRLSGVVLKPPNDLHPGSERMHSLPHGSRIRRQSFVTAAVPRHAQSNVRLSLFSSHSGARKLGALLSLGERFGDHCSR